MENALATTGAGGVPAPAPAAPAKFANPLTQIGGLMKQPAVKRSLPMIFVVGLVLSAALAWMALATPPQRTLFPSLPDSDKQAVVDALGAAKISSSVDDSGGITVAEDDYHRARILLAGQGLPKAAPGGYAILDQLPMGVSRAVEGERLRQARETELAKSIGEIESVADARVHLAMPESSVFVRDNAQPSASVIVRLEPGRSLTQAQVRSIVNLVASSMPGMKADQVTIIDQMGALLSKPTDGSEGSTLSDERIDYQRRIEDKYRAQLNTLLTPLLGAGNFSAEIQADVDLDQSQATRESYDKQGVVRAEQGNWAGNTPGETAPGGVPGALSNTPPAASTLATATPGPAGATVQPGTAPGATPPVKTTENFSRAYDLGKEVSVTRAAPGSIRRLSVAVLLREPEGAKPRTPAEIQQINDLVKAAVGYNQQRQDTVTVISRKFSPEAVAGDVARPWYDADWVPMAARNGTALIIALLVLFMGVRPMVKAINERRKADAAAETARVAAAEAAAQAALNAPAGPAPVSMEMLETAQNYDDRVGLVRGFTRDNPTRAALAIRDMIQSDTKQ
ncbi:MULTISPECIES: flagellar basal-body MS-ring/collar protein FliF [Sphingomonas]|jgi:flagellar M-ring protein FliF|uniref:Flagellar M-ring protein n=1 Tax=Sphingomonas hankookensis TaxID=563996 RepID=A0ABR5Y811_9SPHN|nr:MULTISPECIES: flagellar basal-body MS-ring/collar protein FliF [Sphingomonas]KZE08695.1 flagellar M-ring protein FliF [Sphingomonas hankookensis]PZT95733.1 MAG: flagellar M-ring protein FliF [Sphingomonas sp.]RSV32225.1 flagellar M-ring protein FliF [Sphingomonas sp. ABOLH]WCP72973.1 flagellar basal-body MS-ring/collar protein FliF [Sphingomonas hankookensis]